MYQWKSIINTCLSEEVLKKRMKYGILKKLRLGGYASMDPYRHIGYKLEKIIKGTNSW